jgi:hypothetical protein
MCDVYQLLVFILLVFSDGNMKKKLLKIIPLSGQIEDEGMFLSVYSRRLEINIPIHKLISVITGGSSAMRNENFDFICY